MDPVTAMTIDRGRKNTRLLIQPQYSPMPVAEQVAILYCGTHGLLKDVPLEKVTEFEHNFLENIRLNHKEDVLDVIAGGALSDEAAAVIEKTAAEISVQYKA